tara:strand:- start:1012 stop:1227 length:216 start_codon:yes stop_codon:yes gene_type:complete
MVKTTTKKTADAWNYSITSGTRNAFWMMHDEDQLADVFDLVFCELTKDQLDNINKLIDAEIWKKVHLAEKN